MATILITGGSGMIGKSLTTHLITQGQKVIILTRTLKKKEPVPDGVSFALWDINTETIDLEAVSKCDAIVHLAGANVMGKRWTDSYKKEIVESRTESSALLVKALEKIETIKTVVSASAIGWYGADKKPLPLKWHGFVETDPPSADFLGQTCQLWEDSIKPVTSQGKRLALLRFGIVLGKDGGALREFLKPITFGIAGVPGSGRQKMSWIHIDDLCRLIIYALNNEHISGVYNAVAPEVNSNKDVVCKLANLVRPSFHIPISIPKFALKAALGEKSIEVLKSATVNSDKIRNEGFTFLYPSLDAALKELTAKQ
ncbi:MAG: TIGR01777 family oxidoreductase [Ginsengibacter sp.]